MINVGIQDNLKLVSVEMRKDPTNNPMKTALVVGLEIADAAEEDIMGSLTGAEENVSDGNDQEYYFWPFDNEDRDGNPVGLKDILNRIKVYKAQLNHILLGYMVKGTVEAKWNAVLFKGTGIQGSNAEQLLVQPKVVNQVYQNISDGFVELITPFLPGNAADVLKFRVKLIRQSTEKHFSRIPRFAPFWESMDIPKAQSKLAFSKWEKENGFDSGTPSSDAPSPDGGDAKEAEAVDNVFGLNTEEQAPAT